MGYGDGQVNLSDTGLGAFNDVRRANAREADLCQHYEAQIAQLRSQLRALREEAEESVDALKQTILELHDEYFPNVSREEINAIKRRKMNEIMISKGKPPAYPK